jgi:DNA-binding CsgD family transcriptional regulator
VTADMGRFARWRGDRVAARALLEAAQTLTRRVGNEWSLVVILAELALLAQDLEDDALRESAIREALSLLRALGIRWYLPECLELAACAAGGQGQHARAVRLLGAAEAVRDATGLPPPPGDRASIDRATSAARTALGDATFGVAWNAGRRLTTDQAIDYALAPDKPATNRAAPAAPTDPLTRREREVALLIARGFTNRQIAEDLVIAEGTVAIHVNHILNKLSCSSRVQVAAWMGARGLLGEPRA